MKELLTKMLNHEKFTRHEMYEVVLGITKEAYPVEQVSALLTGLQMRGITVDELLGFRDGILATGVPAILDAPRYIDIVGTGGDKKNTFNISTCACFVLAGAGYKVVKHGNYAATSVCGASNVIELHGAKLTNDLAKLNKSLAETNMAYLHASLFALALKYVAPIRRNISFPTAFNLLGPIVNPAQPKCNLLGVATLDQMRLYNNVYQALGLDYCIENSIDGYDEISLTGDFKIASNNGESIYSPADIGMPVAKAEELYGGATREEAMKIFDSVLEGNATESQKNVVIANAAFAIHAYDLGKDIMECVAIARESLDSGKALQALKAFVVVNEQF